VPDEIVEDVVKDRLDQHDWNFGFILDGFPRNHHQAMFFLESYDIDAVVHIHVPDAVVMERIMSRRLCSKCGLDYNLIFHRPKVEDTCDVCAGKLIQRVDDQPKAIQERLSEYHAKTSPTLDLFRKKELVIEVDGTRPADAVHAQIMEQLGNASKCLDPARRGKCAMSGKC
jgi:adenylate kinase